MCPSAFLRYRVKNIRTPSWKTRRKAIITMNIDMGTLGCKYFTDVINMGGGLTDVREDDADCYLSVVEFFCVESKD